jgi:hypothetical protein
MKTKPMFRGLPRPGLRLTARCLSILVLLNWISPSMSAQEMFTRITTGEIATDQEGSLGVTWGDYDGDGYLDLFVGNSTHDGSLTPNSLYRNNGNGTFSKVTADLMPGCYGPTVGGVWGDYDNNGALDLFAPNGASVEAEDQLYRNPGSGEFQLQDSALPVDITPSAGSAWADYDRDGWLDIFVTKGLAGRRYENDRLLRNKGDGTFISMTAAEVGPLVDEHPGSASSHYGLWADYNNDGWPDLLAFNPATSQSCLYRNRRDGSFDEFVSSGLESPPANGFAWGDYDNDGWLDVAAAIAWDPSVPNALFRNLEGTGFANVAAAAGLAASLGSVAAAWGDFDNDGFLDLFLASYQGPNALYRNNRDGTFSKIENESIATDSGRNQSADWGDYDNDGFLDLVVAGGDATPEVNLLYRNNGNNNHWLKVRLVGTVSNRAAIGARVQVGTTLDGDWVGQIREISGGGRWGSQSGLIAHFGLRDAATAEVVRIEWPSGIVQELHDVPVNRILTVTEPPRLIPQGVGAFQIQCWINQSFEVQASTDLTEWTTLETVTHSEAGTLPFVDAQADQHQSRYYRVMAP